MNKTPFEKGYEVGLIIAAWEMKENGLRDLREVLLDLLHERFGPLSDKVLERFQKMSGEELTKLGKALYRAESLEDLGLER